MAVQIFSKEYWDAVAEAARQAAGQDLPEPSAEEVKRVLLDEADRWSPEARHWLGI